MRKVSAVRDVLVAGREPETKRGRAQDRTQHGGRRWCTRRCCRRRFGAIRRWRTSSTLYSCASQGKRSRRKTSSGSHTRAHTLGLRPAAEAVRESASSSVVDTCGAWGRHAAMLITDRGSAAAAAAAALAAPQHPPGCYRPGRSAQAPACPRALAPARHLVARQYSAGGKRHLRTSSLAGLSCGLVLRGGGWRWCHPRVLAGAVGKVLAGAAGAGTADGADGEDMGGGFAKTSTYKHH